MSEIKTESANSKSGSQSKTDDDPGIRRAGSANKGRRMNANRSPWLWVPTIYLAESIPYTIAMAVSVVLYKDLGLSNTEIAFYTSWLYIPWVIKPLWSPFVDIFRTKRFWILVMQLAIGASLACVALTLPAANYVRYSLAILDYGFQFRHA
jgi:PAT family beta-lactamase induction signal transducer AmpG